MPANTPEEWRLAELNQSIDRLQNEIPPIHFERVSLIKTAARAARRIRYLRFVRWFRSPTQSIALWPVGVLTTGPIVVGLTFLLVADLVFGSLSTAMLAFVLGAAVGAVMFSALLYRPTDAELPSAIKEAEASHSLTDEQYKAVSERLTTAIDRCRELVAERQELMASGKVQRAALLQRGWKAMSETEWEDFVVEVCRTLGASVERTPRTTEKDANLSAQFGNRSVAIVTMGEGHTVNSGAVQNALAGQKRHQCDGCAVIINRRFTGAAQDFARHNGCTLVGLEEFPDFVMGKTQL